MDNSQISVDIACIDPEDPIWKWRRTCYRHVRDRAHRLGIEFLMEFSEWWNVWALHWNARGAQDLVMRRWNENGPYADWNVYITTRGESVRDAAWARQNPATSGGHDATH